MSDVAGPSPELEFKAVRMWVRPKVKVNAAGITYEQPKAMTKTGQTRSIPRALITGVDVKTETAKIFPDMFFLLFKPAVLTVRSATDKVEVRTDKATAERARDILLAPASPPPESG